MITQAIYNLLSSDVTIAALIGTRIHYAERPQNGEGITYKLPAIVIQRGSANNTHHLQGPSGRTSGFATVTCLADSYTSASDLANSVNAVLDGYAGLVNLKNAQGADIILPVKYILQDSQNDIPSDHRDGQGEIQTHGIAIDYRFAHRYARSN